MKKKSLLIALIAILAMTMTLFAGCGGGSDDGGSAAGGDAQTYTLKMGGVDAPDDVSTRTMEKFAELVNEKTGGAVTVETYPAGQLGNYDEMYQEIKKGNLDAGLFTVYGSDTTPAIEIVYLPFLTTGLEEYKEVFARDGAVWNEIKQIHADQGVELLGFYNNGYVGIGFAKLSTPKDKLFTMGEKKDELLRVPGMESMQKSAEAMGYNTTVMAYTDVYTAMQTGTVDGEWAGGPTLNYYNFKDVLKYFVDYRGALDMYMMVMNQELFQSMPEEYQTAIMEAADEATEYGNELLAQQDEELIQKMADEGIETIIPTDEQRAEMQKYFKENVWPEITAPFNQDLVKELTSN